MQFGLVLLWLVTGVVPQDSRIIIHDASGTRFSQRVEVRIEPAQGTPANARPLDKGTATDGIFHTRIPSDQKIVKIRVTLNGETVHCRRMVEPFICVSVPEPIPLR